MPDVFISYSVQDEKLARFVRDHLLYQKLDVFLASISLEKGSKWTQEIFQALRTAKWVFFLASQSALKSDNVKYELGGALFTNKKIVPIMWDIVPTQLPTWIAQYQGLCLKDATMESIRQQVSSLAAKVKADKVQGMWVAGAVLAGLFYVLSK